MKILGYIQYHAEGCQQGEFSKLALTDADKAAGWSEKAVGVIDDILESAARICDETISWGLSSTKLEVAQSMQKHCAKAIRAQKSDSPQRAKHESQR